MQLQKLDGHATRNSGEVVAQTEIGPRSSDYSLIERASDGGASVIEEKVLTLIKPTTLIFRVVNNAVGTPATYDVTIEKSDD